MPKRSELSTSTISTTHVRTHVLYNTNSSLTWQVVFKTPLPNASLWNGPTIGLLSNQDKFINGGWWHDNQILGATGDGIDKEEPRAWEGWWNEKIVQLVQLSMKQPDALCVLLTGRGDAKFTELVKRIVESKNLAFDMLVLKPAIGPSNQTFDNTMEFKQAFLTELMETYPSATDIRVYEDRPKHSKEFRNFFEDYNYKQSTAPSRGTISAEVIQVASVATTLEPVTEVAQVHRMVRAHNEELLKQPLHLRPSRLAVKKTVFFTSYIIGAQDTQRLLALADIPPDVPEAAVKQHATNIVICARPCPKDTLAKVGGMGAAMRWEVTGTACYHGGVWAACLSPVPSSAQYHCENPVPLVVLAVKKGARPIDAGKINTWTPLPPNQRFTFDTKVGEKMMLRVEADDPRQDDYQNIYAGSKRKQDAMNPQQQQPQQQQKQPPTGPKNQGIPTGPKAAAGRGGKGGGRGGKAKGRGGRGHYYRSLDDVPQQTAQVYDQNNPPPGPAATRKPGAGNVNANDLGDYY